MNLPSQFDHAVWRVALGTLVSYGLIIAALFVVLFVAPLLLYLAF